jgi:cytochrome P450
MMRAVSTTSDDLDLAELLAANIGADLDPYSAYAAARADSPVVRANHLGADVTMVYSYAEASHVLREQDTYSARINGRWMRPLLGRTILEMDGREHFVHRRLIGHAFRPSVVGRWRESVIVPVIEELLDKIAERGRAEFVGGFTWQMPVRVFAQILGMPSVDLAKWQRWAISLERAAVDWQQAKAAAKEAQAYFQLAIDDRRSNPQQDLITDLVQAEIEGERLPEEVIHGFLRLLVPAGAATTYRLTGNLLLALLRDPAQLEVVRSDRTQIDEAIEEALRWEAPVQFAMRETLHATTLAGVDIPEGTPMMVALGAANRDPQKFPDPDAYDVRRADKQHLSHLAFGDGVHRCLGEHLARLEASIALDMILDRFPNIRLDGEADVIGYAFRSPNRVPVLL